MKITERISGGAARRIMRGGGISGDVRGGAEECRPRWERR
jgi:hypothetical protein